LGAVSYVQSLIGEGWIRYFILIAGIAADNAVGNFTGFYVLETILSFVINSVFGLQGFGFPVYYGVSSLLMIVVMAPVILMLSKDLLTGG